MLKQIQADIELKLRSAGIKVLTKKECILESGFPQIIVSIGILEPWERQYIYSIILSFSQVVLLERDRNIVAFGDTWSRSGLGSTNNLDRILKMNKDLADEFINDYLSVNPK